MNIYYFDNAATTKLDNEVLKEMLPYLNTNYGNASSIYSLGRNSKLAIENAREKVAKVLNCKPNEIYFTSGGSESDNTVLRGIAHAYKNRGNHIITSSIEHPAILETCKELEKEGFSVTYLPVDKDGFISLKDLEQAIRKTTILISIMFANNEIGTIEPIKEIGFIAKKYNIPFHTDAVQAIGNARINVQELNIDALSLSGHKFYGPKGVGALYVKEGINFKKFIAGGHQERNMRAGTENVAGIVGLGKAIEMAYEDFDSHYTHTKMLKDYYLKEIAKRFPDSKINGSIEKRLPGNCNVSFKNINGNKILLKLDENGICASTGSACSSASPKPSHVLSALHLPEEYLNGSLRITIGKYNTKEEVDYLLYNLEKIVHEI